MVSLGGRSHIITFSIWRVCYKKEIGYHRLLNYSITRAQDFRVPYDLMSSLNDMTFDRLSSSVQNRKLNTSIRNNYNTMTNGVHFVSEMEHEIQLFHQI